MKKILLSAAIAASLFTACKKDNDDAPSSYVTVNGETFATPYGYNNVGVNGAIIFSSIDMNAGLDLTTLTKTMTQVTLKIDTLIDGNSYKLYNWETDTVTFDKTKFFSTAIITAGVKLNEIGSSGKLYNEFSTGSVTVKKSANGYSFDYELKAGDSVTVKGVFAGKLGTQE